MALVVGTNSWASVAEANEYLGNRVGTTAWFSLADEAANPGEAGKDTYLMTAFYWISAGYGIPATDSAPDALKQAQILTAFWLIGNREEYEKRETLIASGVESFDWSRWSESLGEASSLPTFITDLLLAVGAGSSNQAVQLYGDDYE